LIPNRLSHNSIGFFHNAKGDYDRALAEINEALRLEPKFGSGAFNTGSPRPAAAGLRPLRHPTIRRYASGEPPATKTPQPAPA
jgi:hypothetical protein